MIKDLETAWEWIRNVTYEDQDRESHHPVFLQGFRVG